MLVREHINFERGLEPKKSMGIGLWAYNIKVGDKLKPKDFVLIDKTGKIVNQENKNTDTVLPKVFLPDQYVVVRDVKYIKTKIRESVSLKLIKPPGIIRHMNATIEELMKYFNDPRTNESLNFERGLDPKEAMHTGDIDLRNREKIFRDLEYSLSVLQQSEKILNPTIKELENKFKGMQKTYVIELKFSHPKVHDPMYIGCTYNAVNKKINYWIESSWDDGSTYYDTIEECIQKYQYFFKNNFESQFMRGLDPKDAMDIGGELIKISGIFYLKTDLINNQVTEIPEHLHYMNVISHLNGIKKGVEHRRKISNYRYLQVHPYKQLRYEDILGKRLEFRDHIYKIPNKNLYE